MQRNFGQLGRYEGIESRHPKDALLILAKASHVAALVCWHRKLNIPLHIFRKGIGSLRLGAALSRSSLKLFADRCFTPLQSLLKAREPKLRARGGWAPWRTSPTRTRRLGWAGAAMYTWLSSTDVKARSKFRWKWKKKRTRRLQKKRRKMRQRSK